MNTYDTVQIESELAVLKNRLDDIISRTELLPSGKKAKMMGYIRDLDILAAEVEDRIAHLQNEGYDDGDFWRTDVKINIDDFRNDFTESSGMYMDYDYSG